MFFQARFCSPCAAGFAGLFVIAFFQTEKLPPLVAVFALAGVCIVNAENIVFALQVSKKFWGFSASAGFVGFLFGDFENMLPHLFHVNLLLLSVFHIALVIDIVLILFGQGADGHAKAFTMTADWIFSTQAPPPPLEYRGHYLCTVAAGGHRSIVKPLRFGIRRGHRIIINRQLAVATALEINTNGKLSRELAGAVTQADFAKEQNRIIFGDDALRNSPAQKGDGKPLNTQAPPKAEKTENSPDFQQSARQLAQIEHDKHLKKIVDIYNFAIEKIRENPQLLEVKEELEAQALQAEEIERYNPNPYVCEVINGKSYRMRKSQKAKLDCIVKKGLEEWQKALEEGKKWTLR